MEPGRRSRLRSLGALPRVRTGIRRSYRGIELRNEHSRGDEDGKKAHTTAVAERLAKHPAVIACAVIASCIQSVANNGRFPT